MILIFLSLSLAHSLLDMNGILLKEKEKKTLSEVITSKRKNDFSQIYVKSELQAQRKELIFNQTNERMNAKVDALITFTHSY